MNHDTNMIAMLLILLPRIDKKILSIFYLFLWTFEYVFTHCNSSSIYENVQE